jgi:photosystem II stability/assembly factor-like uncharacterized protein
MFSISIVEGQYIYGSGNVNSNGSLYKSTNLGVTWDSLLYSPGIGYGYLYFINKDTGLIGGGDTYDNFIYRTTDGGLTKQLVATFGGNAGGKFFFLKEKVNGEYYGWMYYPGNLLLLYQTTNSGLNWIEKGTYNDVVSSVYFLNKDTGWATIPYDRGFILYTSNGGINWITNNIPTGNATTDICFSTKEKGWFCTFTKIYATTTSGNIWGQQILPSAYTSKLFFLDSLNGWTGTGNQLAHTTNGGGPILAVNNQITIQQTNYILKQNYPNPFNSKTIIKYQISKNSFIKINIYDIKGQQITTLVNREQQSGEYKVIFDAGSLSSGIYLYQLVANEKEIETKKLILLK